MARRVLAALAVGAALTLTACGEELPTDPPTMPDFGESLEELAPDLPTDLGSDIMEIVPDVDPTEILGKVEEACQKIAEGKEEEELARDIADLFGVEEADGASLVETIEPHCDTIG